MKRPLLEGVTQSQFGREIMKWGTGHAAARARIRTITTQELKRQGVTVEMAEAWRDFYRAVARENPNNPSAAGRVDLMEHVVELLREEP